MAQRRVGALYYGQSERRGFAGTGLCESHDVAVFVEQVWDYFLLYRHRFFKSHILDCVQQVFSYF